MADVLENPEKTEETKTEKDTENEEIEDEEEDLEVEKTTKFKEKEEEEDEECEPEQPEKEPKKRSKKLVIIQFLLPWAIAAVEFLILYLVLDMNTFTTLSFWMTIYFFPPFGKETVIPLAIAGDSIESVLPISTPDTMVSIHPIMIALAIASIDIIVGLFLLWNLDFAKKIPILGKWIKKMEAKGETILEKNKYIEAFTFIGVVLFVMFPFQGSGAVGASIVGKFVGLEEKKVWFAIIIGAIGGCLLIAFAFETFRTIFMANRFVGALLLIIIFAIVIFFILRKRRNAACKVPEKKQNDQ